MPGRGGKPVTAVFVSAIFSFGYPHYIPIPLPSFGVWHSMECVIKIRKEMKISDRRGRRRDGRRRKEKPQAFVRGGADPTGNKRRRCNAASMTPCSRVSTASIKLIAYLHIVYIAFQF
ncbi:hypothetical protein J6590_099159 [Homalodisca vitripennis]|nr:hypothetical protein J6590_099159 [Homalodisca vitripennis]